jgi:response regulator RpfG family c-di-GMP phosphodiesterase
MNNTEQSILLIDDDLDMLSYLEKSLFPLSCKIYKAANKAQATTLIKKVIPSVILLDLDLDMESGYDVLSFIRSLPDLSVCPVIVLSCYPADQEYSRSLEFGADDYIEKPFNKSLLYIKVKNQLKIKRVQNTIVDKERAIQISNSLEEGILEISDSFEILWANSRAHYLFSFNKDVNNYNLVHLFEKLQIQIKENLSLYQLLDNHTDKKIVAWIPSIDNRDTGLYSMECISKKEGYNINTYLIRVTSLNESFQKQLSVYLFEHFIAHKLNTPMNQILLPLQMLQEEQSLSSEGADLLQTAINAAQELHQKHTSLLQFINIQTIKPDKIDCLSFTHFLKTVKDFYTHTNVSLNLECDRLDYIPSLNINKKILTLMLSEFVSNTKRYARLESPFHKIQIKTSGTSILVFTLTDNSDIPHSTITNKLLLPFEQIDKFNYKSDNGLGLGLSKLRLLLWSINGEIYLKDDHNTESFTITVHILINKTK